VAIGARIQGTHITAKLVKEFTKMKWTEVTNTLIFDSVFVSLLNKEIDAFFFVGAAPVSKLAKIPPQSNIKIIPLEDNRLAQIYKPIVIKAGTYNCATNDINTFAVKSVLATNIKDESKTHRKNILALLTDIKNNIETLQTKGHPKWKEANFSSEALDWEWYSGAEEILNPKGVLSDLILLSSSEGSSSYQFAQDMQKISSKVKGIKVSQGSMHNLRELINRDETYVTFLQFDVLIQQQLEDAAYLTNYSENIRILLPLGNEEIHLIIRKNDRIHTLKDLKKKRVAIGTINEGTYVTAGLIKELTRSKWIDVPMTTDSALTALANNKIDAFFFVGSAPISKLQKLPAQTNFAILPITDKKLDDIYTKTTIKASTYLWEDQNVETYSIKSVLVTNIADETIEQRENIKQLLIDIHDKIDILKKDGHPKWKEVNFDLKSVYWEAYKTSKTIFR